MSNAIKMNNDCQVSKKQSVLLNRDLTVLSVIDLKIMKIKCMDSVW